MPDLASVPHAARNKSASYRSTSKRSGKLPAIALLDTQIRPLCFGTSDEVASPFSVFSQKTLLNQFASLVSISCNKAM